jgi:ActR/RegA family two-component response regulator
MEEGMFESARMLLVDDDEQFTPVFVERFSAAGYAVRVAANVNLATQAFAQEEFDLLVISDQVEGNEALQFIADLPKVNANIEVIVVTSIPDIHNAMRALPLPVAMYTTKPPDWVDLQCTVEQCVTRHRLGLAIRAAAEQRAVWHEQLTAIARAVAQFPDKILFTSATLDSIVKLSLENAAMSLDIIRSLAGEEGDPVQSVSALLGNKGDETLLAAVCETIAVLERTKTAFKSKELGILRRKLEGLVETKTNDLLPK